MTIWVLALECYDNEFQDYPVEVALLNVTDAICYTYHISYSPNLMDRHKSHAQESFEKHGLGLTDGNYAYDWAKQTLHDHITNCGCRDTMYVFNQEHIYLVKTWFRRLGDSVCECPPLDDDESCHDETCEIHKQLGEKFSCARRKCFQVAKVIANQ